MKLSGYTTTRNCVSMDYPFEESISSLAEFCDEVVVMDSSDGSDATQDILSGLEKKYKGIVNVYHADIDWSAPNHGIYDGALKQAAREQCTGDVLWQSDVDEVVHKSDRQVLDNLVKQLNNLSQIPLLCVPVVEYWGSEEKVRIDINSWKWTVSRKDSDITHGIPVTHRKTINGMLYARPGTDGCDYISKSTGRPLPNMNFITEQSERTRMLALTNNEARDEYEKWFNQMVNGLPTVYHYSWFDIEKKIRNYREFWSNFWPALYGEKPKYNNVFFDDVPWEHVTDEMIHQKAEELKKTGGHIFHKPYDGSIINHVKIDRKAPEIMDVWKGKHSK